MELDEPGFSMDIPTKSKPCAGDKERQARLATEFAEILMLKWNFLLNEEIAAMMAKDAVDFFAERLDQQ